MEFLAHFIFQTIKIGILSGIYSFIIIRTVLILNRFWKVKKADEIKKEPNKYWFVYSLCIGFVLFIYSLTYFGNHGLGDSARIPIGHWKSVENINWTDVASIKNLKILDRGAIYFTEYTVYDGKLMGKLYEEGILKDSEYFLYNLKTKELIEFATKEKINHYALENNLPFTIEYLKFDEHYRNYWGGWRFFLLP